MALQTGPYGFVYPPATDPVRDGSAAIKALSDQMRPNGAMVAAQPPVFGGSVPDPTKVRIAVYNMDIATNASGVATFGHSFTTAVLGLWIQQIYNAAQNMAHFTVQSVSGSGVNVLCRATNTGAPFASQYFSVNVILIGY
jgi:hypothetical protein